MGKKLSALILLLGAFSVLPIFSLNVLACSGDPGTATENYNRNSDVFIGTVVNVRKVQEVKDRVVEQVTFDIEKSYKGKASQQKMALISLPKPKSSKPGDPPVRSSCDYGSNPYKVGDEWLIFASKSNLDSSRLKLEDSIITINSKNGPSNYEIQEFNQLVQELEQNRTLVITGNIDYVQIGLISILGLVMVVLLISALKKSKL